MQFWIDVENAAHTRIGEGPVTTATRCVTRKRLNRVGEFSFEMPATDERAELISARRGCSIMGMVEGVETYLGGGPVDEIRTRIGTDGIPLLSVSGSDLLAELSRISVGKLSLTGTGDANITTLLGIVSAAPLSWVTTREAGSPDFRARFVYESTFNSLFSIAEKTGAYFRLNTQNLPTRSLEWFYTISSSGILATMHGDPVAIEDNPDVCLITTLEIVEDSSDLKTRAYLFGSGEGDGVTTALYAQNWPDLNPISIYPTYTRNGQVYSFNRTGNYVVNTTAEAAYGRDEIALAFKDIMPIFNTPTDMIAASNFVLVAALEYLDKNYKPYTAYKLQVAGLRSTLEPGQTIRVQARRFREGEKPVNIDEDLFVLEVENTIDTDGIRTSGLTVANLQRWPVSAGEEIAREMANSKILSAHPQTGPNVDTISYREHVDDTHNATLQFWLGEETTTVQSVMVRFRVDPLRSTVKSVAGASQSSGSSNTASSGAGGAVTTLPISGSSTTDSGGPSGIYAPNTSSVTATAGVAHAHAEPHIHNIPHNHTLTLSDHAHGIGHDHTFTPSIAMNYGVFDDTAGHTYAATDLDWKTAADAGWTAVASGDAISGASGWYGIEISGRIATDGRPATAVNDVQFRVRPSAVAIKSAQLTVQIERRTTIQSIATY